MVKQCTIQKLEIIFRISKQVICRSIFELDVGVLFQLLAVADPATGVGGRVAPPSPPAENVTLPGQKLRTIHESLPSLACKPFFYKPA